MIQTCQVSCIMHRTYSISRATVPVTPALVRAVPWPCSRSSARVPGAAAQPLTWPHGPASSTGKPSLPRTVQGLGLLGQKTVR